MQRAIIIKRVLKFDSHLLVLTRNAVRFRSRYERSINFAIQIKRTKTRTEIGLNGETVQNCPRVGKYINWYAQP